MEKIELVDKLRDKTNISYEEAKNALENNNWDILDAIVYLEEQGIIKKPNVSTFYTNKYKESYKTQEEVIKVNESENSNNSKSRNDFEGIFEVICKVIDTWNNIFIEIGRKNRVFLKIPFTVLIVLFIFTFWITIPLIVVGLIFDIEFLVSSKKINTDKVNKIFSDISKDIKKIKEKIKKGFNND